MNNNLIFKEDIFLITVFRWGVIFMSRCKCIYDVLVNYSHKC